MVNPIRALVTGLKADRATFPLGSRGSTWWISRAGYVDLRKVGKGLGNSAVIACLRVLETKFPEAIPRVVEEDETGEEKPIIGHSAAELLRRPNPYMTWGLLSSYAIVAGHVAGDVYLLVVRNGAGEPIALWPLNPDFVEIRSGDDSDVVDSSLFIDHYSYSPQGRPIPLTPIEDVIHLRPYGLDPEDYRHGKAPIKSVLREVLTDEEAGQFSAALLGNLGIPGVVIAPKSDSDTIGETAAKRLADTWQAKFGGRNRGEPFISSGAVDVKVLSFTPEQMNLTALRRVPEERVSAVTGVPAILAGLGAGLERATYSNVEELKTWMTEDTLVPTWLEYGEQLTLQFFEPNYNPPPNQRIAFDITKVRALQDDRDKLATRWGTLVEHTIAPIAEARAAMNLPVQPEHEVFLLPAGKVAVTLEGLAAEAEPLDLGGGDENDEPTQREPGSDDGADEGAADTGDDAAGAGGDSD